MTGVYGRWYTRGGLQVYIMFEATEKNTIFYNNIK